MPELLDSIDADLEEKVKYPKRPKGSPKPRYDIRWESSGDTITFRNAADTRRVVFTFDRSPIGVPRVTIVTHLPDPRPWNMSKDTDVIVPLGTNVGAYLGYQVYQLFGLANDTFIGWDPVYQSRRVRDKIFEAFCKKHYGKLLTQFVLSRLTREEVGAGSCFRKFENVVHRLRPLADCDNPYVYKDILKYKACRFALVEFIRDPYDGTKTHVSKWRDVFGTNRDKNLNVSIDKFRGSLGIIHSFKNVIIKYDHRLARPLINPKEIQFLASLQHIIALPTPADWRKFLTLLRKDGLRRPYGKFFDYEFSRVALEINDYLNEHPEHINRTLPNLYLSSKEWHRADQIKKRTYGLPPDTPTALPPCGLPEIKGIRFLTTVGEIVDEGFDMKHCVGSRTFLEHAVSGKSFIFHCDWGGERATIEVGMTQSLDIHYLTDAQRGNIDPALPCNYTVKQSFGPCNQTNKASTYALRELTKYFSNANGVGNQPACLAG